MKLFTFLAALLLVQATAIQAHEKNEAKLSQDTRIETDSEADEIRFIIKGEAVGVLKADGLRINGDVTAESFLHGPKSVANTNDSETGGAE